MQKGVSVFFVWIVIFYLACKVHGQANTGSLVFETIGDNKGLSNNNVNSILQDSKGFIWIGTRYGLNCYDGITCRTFFNEEGSRESIPDNHINQMAEDHAGNLWIGTGMGISCLNLSTRRFINFLHTDADRNELKNLNFNVFADKSGTIWASNGYFLLRYEKNSNHFKKFPLDGGQSTGLVRNYFVLDFLQDSKNRIWLATSYGVKLLNPETGQTQSFHFPETIARLKENAITAIEEAPDGTIFAGTWGGGLLQWNEELRKFELFDSQLSLGKNWNKIVFDIKFFKGQIYLGTNDGLLTTSYLTSKSLNHSTTWLNYATEKENPRSLSGNIVQKISIDREENIWLATNDNLTCADMRMARFQHFKNLVFKSSSFFPNAIVETNSKRKGQEFWVAGPGLFSFKKNNEPASEVGVEKYIGSQGLTGMVWDIAKGKKQLWLATTNGLIAFDPEKRTITAQYGNSPEKDKAPAGNRLWKVFEDSKGHVWVAAIRTGVSMLDPATGTFRHFFNTKDEPGSLFNITPTAFFEDSNGGIWFGGEDFLYFFSYKTNRFRVIPFAVLSKQNNLVRGKPQPFFEDNAGNIWLAFEKGIASIHPLTFDIKPKLLQVPYFKPDGNVVTGEAGEIWFGTLAGLFRLDTAGLRLTRFTTRNGLLSNETDACLTKFSDGSMATGSDGYVTCFSPNQLKAATSFAPPVAFSRVQVNGRDTLLEPIEPVRLPFQSTIQFDFAALSFTNASQNSYSFKLEGAENEWNNPTNKQIITYAKLSPGHYTFWLKGCNSDGVWNPEAIGYSFMVDGPFYLKTWFIGLILLLISAVIVSIYRYRLGQALRVERMRTRLATDLHDDVGATLSAISMYSEALKKQVNQPQLAGLLGKIGEDSRETIINMSDLVWAINPKNDKGEKLVKRMENYAFDLCTAREVKSVFKKDDRLFSKKLDIETRRNIFLIFKETLNNALKYSGCTLITIDIQLRGNNLHLTIEDNGAGFNAEKIMPGNGLLNMQERATALKGKLIIDAKPGMGCMVQLHCPV